MPRDIHVTTGLQAMFWLKQIWERFKTLLYLLIVAYLIAVAIYSWFFAASEYKPRAGEPCDPNHRWRYTWPPWDPDLSCEKSRN
jgi:hypothetical protein